MLWLDYSYNQYRCNYGLTSDLLETLETTKYTNDVLVVNYICEDGTYHNLAI